MTLLQFVVEHDITQHNLFASVTANAYIFTPLGFLFQYFQYPYSQE